MSPISVSLADPSLAFLRGLHSYLEDEPDIQVAAAATCGEEAAAQAVRLQLNVALIDLRLKWNLVEDEPSEANGLRLAMVLNQSPAAPAILVFAGCLEARWLLSLVDAGVRGCLAKDDDPALIVSAVRAAAAGMCVWTPAQLAILRSQSVDCLTQREREVLALVAQGCTNGEVAGRLGISVGAINKHVEHIFAKLHVHTRTQAVAVARQRGLLGYRV